MNAFPQQSDRRGSIKSLSLQDIVNARPPLFRRAVEIAKTALMIWGAISLSAAAGYATLQLQRSAEPVLKSERTAVATTDKARPAAPTRRAAQKLVGPTEGARASRETSDQALAARLPRPRPEDPIITGSIPRVQPDHRRYAQARYDDPCEAWNSLGMPFRLRCVRESELAPRYYGPYPQHW
jgi:hypothetical protein